MSSNQGTIGIHGIIAIQMVWRVSHLPYAVTQMVVGFRLMWKTIVCFLNAKIQY